VPNDAVKPLETAMAVEISIPTICRAVMKIAAYGFQFSEGLKQQQHAGITFSMALPITLRVASWPRKRFKAAENILYTKMEMRRDD